MQSTQAAGHSMVRCPGMGGLGGCCCPYTCTFPSTSISHLVLYSLDYGNLTALKSMEKEGFTIELQLHFQDDNETEGKSGMILNVTC